MATSQGKGYGTQSIVSCHLVGVYISHVRFDMFSCFMSTFEPHFVFLILLVMSIIYNVNFEKFPYPHVEFEGLGPRVCFPRGIP